MNSTMLPISKTNVKISDKTNLNQTKGKIFRYDFKFLTDEEIIQGLKDQRNSSLQADKKKTR